MQMDEFARSTENPNHGIKTAGNVKINLDNLKMLEKVYSGFMKIDNDYGKVLHDNKIVEAKEIVNNYSSQVIKIVKYSLTSWSFRRHSKAFMVSLYGNENSLLKSPIYSFKNRLASLIFVIWWRLSLATNRLWSVWNSRSTRPLFIIYK